MLIENLQGLLRWKVDSPNLVLTSEKPIKAVRIKGLQGFTAVRDKIVLPHTDYFLWEVIKNGNKVLIKPVGSSEQTYEPTIAEEKKDRRNDIKARGTLLMALPNKDQLEFHSYHDAKLLMEAIEKRYGGNKESKKVQRILLKQLYKNFAALRSSNTNQNPQNMAFVSSKSTRSTNEEDTTTSGVSTAHTHGTTINSTSVDNLSDAMICAFIASQPNTHQLAKEDLEQINPNDLEEMDLH
nr:hypothetical protein [Tanacetum cinerariifolium]